MQLEVELVLSGIYRVVQCCGSQLRGQINLCSVKMINAREKEELKKFYFPNLDLFSKLSSNPYFCCEISGDFMSLGLKLEVFIRKGS